MTPRYRTKRTQTKKKYVRKRRRRILLIAAPIVGVIIALAAVGVVWGGGLARYIPFLKGQEKGPAFTQPKERVTLLLVGRDEKDLSRKADTMVLVTYSPKKQDLNLIWIPRNTLVEIPGYNAGEIAQAFSYGRMSLSISTVEYLFGVNVDHYLEVDGKGLKGIVDKLGGLSVGSERVTGDKAAKYLSSTSSTEEEVDRIERQQKFVAALFSKVKEKSVYEKLSSLAKALRKAVGTDFSAQETGNLALVFGAVEGSKFSQRVLPVTEVTLNNKVYYQPNKQRLQALLDRIFGSELASKQGKASFKIRVLNGVGQPGIGTEVAKKLLDNGYRVVDTKNADNFDYKETQLIIYSNKSQDLAAVNRIKSLLGVGKIVINNLPQDVANLTIIVGADYRSQTYVPEKKLEVLNGSGKAGVAASATEALTRAGFKVAKTENADRSDYEKTKLLLHVDNQAVRAMAEQIKSILGVGEIGVSGVSRTDIEVTVIIGQDYQGD